MMTQAHCALSILLLAASALARSNLPNHTELLVTVLADEAWVRGESQSLDTMREVITESITSARSDHVSMEVDFRTLVPGNLSDKVDLEQSSVVVTITDCAKTHEINMELVEAGDILHVGVTDLACSRLEEAGILVPMIPPGSGLIQLLTDFK